MKSLKTKNPLSCQSILLLVLFLVSACVTEPKNEEQTYLKYDPSAAGNKIAPTKITVHCHVQKAKSKRTTPCAETKVKILNQVSKATHTENFKKGSGVVTVGNEVYTLEVSTSSCSVVRNFSGLMAGMSIDAYFEPPCGGR